MKIKFQTKIIEFKEMEHQNYAIYPPAITDIIYPPKINKLKSIENICCGDDLFEHTLREIISFRFCPYCGKEIEKEHEHEPVNHTT